MGASQMGGPEAFPQEVLVRIFHFLPIKQRSMFACISSSWRAASCVDAVETKLTMAHVPSYLHVALPDEAAQMQAAACPVVSLARSASITLAPTTGRMLESMPSLERLAFSSVSSEALPRQNSLESLRSLTKLQALQVDTSDANTLLEGLPSAPASVTELELHLHGENWSEDVLDRINAQIGSQFVSQLRQLSLRCSHASAYESVEHLEHLGALTGLTSLRIGPNPEDANPKASPLGFPRLPAFLAELHGLQVLDISVADAPQYPSIQGMSFGNASHVPDVDLTLRADTSFREICAIPPALGGLTGLTKLAIHSFSFEDPGGWCTVGRFDVGVLAACKKLRHLEMRLRNWGAEHCEAFELQGLEQLGQLQHLQVGIAAAYNLVCTGETPQVPEVRMALPPMKSPTTLQIACSVRLVLRNSRLLARAKAPALLAHSILLEEPLPAAAAAAPLAVGQQQQQQQRQYCRAPAHVVVSALRDLWLGIEVWQYPGITAKAMNAAWGSGSTLEFPAELLCRKGANREHLKQHMFQVLQLAGASPCPQNDLIQVA